MTGQTYFLSHGAYSLSARLRDLTFKSLLRQDGKLHLAMTTSVANCVPVEYFDKDEHNTGALTTQLSEHPQRVNGLAGITLGAIVQATTTVIIGSAIGIAYMWKVGLVGLACTPLVISAGYIRLVRLLPNCLDARVDIFFFTV